MKFFEHTSNKNHNNTKGHLIEIFWGKVQIWAVTGKGFPRVHVCMGAK